jgi:hypothetical protein
MEKGCLFAPIDIDRLLTTSGSLSVCDDVRTYCSDLMTLNGVMASGVGLLGSDKVFDENSPGVSPGGVLNKYGYFVIATSVGGNALSVHVSSGLVYWSDTSCLDEVEVAIRQPSGDYEYRPCSSEAVEAAMNKLADDLGGFIYMLLADELTDRMDALDS